MGHNEVAPVKDSYIGMIAVLLTAVFLVPPLVNAAVSATSVPNTALLQALALLMQQMLFGLVAIWHLRINLRLPWAAFGIRPISSGRVKYSVLVGIALVAVNGIGVWIGRFLGAALLGSARAMALFYREEAMLMGMFRHEQSPLILTLLLMAVVVLAPVSEELFFRGYLYAALKSKIGGHAVWVSSLLFTIVHFYIIHAVPVFLLALALAWLYERRGVIWENVLAHAALNGAVAVLLLLQRS